MRLYLYIFNPKDAVLHSFSVTYRENSILSNNPAVTTSPANFANAETSFTMNPTGEGRQRRYSVVVFRMFAVILIVDAAGNATSYFCMGATAGFSGFY
jgi:hypothetical protein